MADEPILVGTPDGQRFQFPAGTDRLTMKRAIDEHYRSTAVGQGGAPSMPADSTKTPDKWSPEAMMRDDRSLTSAIPGADWLRTGAINAAGNAATFGDMISPVGPIRNVLGMVAPETANALDSGRLVRHLAHKEAGAPIVNTPAEYGGKVADAARDAAIGSVMFPGGVVRNMIPAAVGGATSELAGQQAAGTPYEVPARVAAGLAGGAAVAGVQAAGGAAVRGAQNLRGAPAAVEDTATRIVGRSIDRDKLTPQQLLARMKDLGDEAMPVDAGGENVRGALRGSIAAPGPARTTVRNALTDRADSEGARVGASIDKNVSPKGLTQTVDDLITQRNTEPKPLYEKALNVDQVSSPRVQQFLDDPLFKPALAKGIEIQRIEALARGEKFDPKSYGITGFAADGSPIISGTPNMRALDAVKKGVDGILEGYRDTTTGRLVLDERGRAIDMARKAFVTELDRLNPDYAAARAAYATPSQMKDAAELGQRLFANNSRPDMVKREFDRLTPDGQESFRVGVAEHLRKIAGARDSANVAGRVMGGPDAQARLTAVLGKEEADRLLADLGREKTFTRTARDVGQGSRTTPMALEADDNAGAAAGVIGDVARGRFVNALSKATGRLTEGRTEAVNARVAEILTSMKPEERTAFASALEDALLRQRLNSPRNAFRAGTGAPLPGVARRDRE